MNKTPLAEKSSTETIKARFDKDVERFSNLDTGQLATIDAPLAMELITSAALACTPQPKYVLDIGCGAGNNTVLLSQKTDPFDCHLVDLSLPMLKRAQQRVSGINSGKIDIFQGDFRDIPLPQAQYDIIIAAAVLHHLRDDADWERAFARLFTLTAPGGSIWITDLVWHETEQVQHLMWDRYADYLCSCGGEEYRDKVFAYIEEEDSPRPVTYQLELLRKSGFNQVELLHKNSSFAAFGALKTKE